MSAFHDIWIGNSKPPCHRVGQTAWSRQELYWQSIATQDKAMVTYAASIAYEMIVLGQFYEKVDIDGLLNSCVNYATGTTHVFEDPAGHYIIFLIEKIGRTTHVFTNRFGTYHAYWLQSEGVNTISTYYMALAKHCAVKKLDWQGITGFLAMGFFPADKTYLDSIKIFSPASLYSFNNETGQVASKRYWNWTYEPASQSVPALVSSIHDRLSASLSFSLADHTTAMPVSGGLDSRMLAGIVNDVKQNNIWAYSYGYTPNSPEIKIGRSICNSLELPFHNYVIDNYLFNKLETINSSVEFFQYVDGTRQAAIIGQLSAGADVVVGGHLGDLLFDDMATEQYDSNNIFQGFFAKRIVKKGSGWLLKNVIAEKDINAKGFLDDYFNTEIQKYRYLKDPDFIMKAYKVDQSVFRWTMASLRMYQAAVMPVLPFYDKYVTDVFATIPHTMLSGRKLQLDYIKMQYPALAAITWQEYNRNLYNYKYLNNRNYFYRAFKKAQQTVSGRKTITRNWELFYLNADGRKNLEQLLFTGELLSIVPAVKITTLLDDLYKNPTAANGYSVSMLLTFACFLKTLYN